MMNVNSEKCIGCGQCVKDCFARDIEIIDGKAKINNITCIKCGHCIAVCPKNAVSTDEYNMEDVKEYNKEDFSIDADTLLNFIKFRRTIRQFEDKKIEDEKIIKIIEAGRFTQTASNMQDVSYIVVRDRIQDLRKLIIESLNQIGEKILKDTNEKNILYQRYAKIWIDMYKEYKENPKNDRLFFNAPVVIVVTARQEVNGALASSNMELMINSLGLGTLFSGFSAAAAQMDEKISKFLGVKKGRKVVTFMIVGYPNVKYLRTVPRKKADIRWK